MLRMLEEMSIKDKKLSLLVKTAVLLFILFYSFKVFAWHDETHLAVAKAAGYYKWYNAAGADIAKLKAGRVEGNNHWFDNPDELEVTPAMVLSQVKHYNDPDDRNGHLYGAIIASLREYKKSKGKGKYGEYNLAFCAHYVADLSQPFHNIPYDDFNKARHSLNEEIVEKEVLQNLSRIKDNMYEIKLRPDKFEEDLSKEIARIANISRRLGVKLKTEKRNMTKKEIYRQLGHSASLLKAILMAL